MMDPVKSPNNRLADLAIGALSIVHGLAVTLRNALRPGVTRDYPARRTYIYPRFRGRMIHKRGEDHRPKCTACLACQKACPTLAIPEIAGDEKKGRERRAKAYLWDASRCLFCNLCVDACPFDAIELGQEYSLVGESRDQMRFELEDLLEPAEDGES
jgi:NADH-quinone oxidoreductase subunit I